MSSRAFLDARELSDVLERKLNDDGAPQRDVGVARKNESLLAHPQPSLHGNANLGDFALGVHRHGSDFPNFNAFS